jgi:hypothetical protein
VTQQPPRDVSSGIAISCGNFKSQSAMSVGPVGEGEVGCDQQRGVFVDLADQVEEQLTAGLAEREVAELASDFAAKDRKARQREICVVTSEKPSLAGQKVSPLHMQAGGFTFKRKIAYTTNK